MSHYFPNPISASALQANHGKGRPRGSLNKHHAIVRWGLTEAYRRLGGVEGLVKWGKRNPTEFYQLLGRLIPAEIADQHGTSDTKIQVVILPAQEQRIPKHLPQATEVSATSSSPDEAGGGSSAAGGAM
jgi:hypothetical protein